MKSAIFSAVAVVFTLPALVHGGVILADSAQENVVINNNRIHVGDEPDLGSTRFVGWGPFVGTSWEVSFSLPADTNDATLNVESFDVEAPPDFQDRVLLNGVFVGNLAYAGPPNWYSGAAAMAVPPNTLHAGLNTLRIESGYGQGIYDTPTYDDFGVGQISLAYIPEPSVMFVIPFVISSTIVRRRRHR